MGETKPEAKVETVVPEPEIEHFDVGDTPLDPTDLNTDTLSLQDSPSAHKQRCTPADSPGSRCNQGH